MAWKARFEFWDFSDFSELTAGMQLENPLASCLLSFLPTHSIVSPGEEHCVHSHTQSLSTLSTLHQTFGSDQWQRPAWEDRSGRSLFMPWKWLGIGSGNSGDLQQSLKPDRGTVVPGRWVQLVLGALQEDGCGRIRAQDPWLFCPSLRAVSLHATSNSLLV